MFEYLIDAEAWKSELLTRQNVVKAGVRLNNANVATAIARHPRLMGSVAFDEFAGTVVRAGSTTWNAKVGPWGEIDDLALSDFLQREGLDVTPDVAALGVRTIAEQNRFHPVRDFLGQLEWDGVPRIDEWLITYLGAESSPYVRAIGPRFLIGAVARAMEPGCKMDTMLVLEGEQGIGKSTAVCALFGAMWFADSLPDLSSKDAALQLQAKWVVEIAELDAFKRAEITEIKAFISRTSDRFRPPYGRHAIDRPRQCVFVGTTNCDDYLKDATGNRRFWPVRCTQTDIRQLSEDREQLWAEAVERFAWGEQWHLTFDEEALACREQSIRLVEDAWGPQIDAYVWTRDKVTTEEVLEHGLELPLQSRDQLTRRRVNQHLTRWGWVHKKSGSQRPLVRPTIIPDEKLQYAPQRSTIMSSTEERYLGL